MSGDQPKPDLTFASLIHQSLRTGAARIAADITALSLGNRLARLPGIQAFFGRYRAQLAIHHRHEDELFFPALAATTGAGRIQLTELTGQHERPGAAVQAVHDRPADLAGDFTTDRGKAASALSVMATLLRAHLTLEEQAAPPLLAQEIPAEHHPA
jgi:hypothetical protein